ncbi:alpha/beta fold hydrolase [Thiomonas sp. FB-6]|uniref:alpha/beta fold hydrolase n=1 Tax=Thiomonas sp. FB-6 TaxID=1158291 RepID=UPI00037EF7AE|nr:alpha/beta hydrolase [Thiomonas sp. FB-6]
MSTQPSEDRFAELPAGTRICWREAGAAQAQPLLLINGLAMQLISWPERLVEGLAAAGLRVIMPDNRDAGLSSAAASAPPGRLRQLLALAPPDNYALEDMADDMAGLLDHLGVGAAHVVGMSMGGMIAQCLAARHPARVLSLCSIFSTTGRRTVGQPAPSTILRMLRPVPRSAAEAVRQYVEFMHHIGNPAEPGAPQEWADYALRAWQRGGGRVNAEGTARQVAAIQKSGDRSAQLCRIRAPTLVLHGDRDLMVAPSGGRATAELIPGASLRILPGLAHQIVAARSPELVGLIVDNLRA